MPISAVGSAVPLAARGFPEPAQGQAPVQYEPRIAAVIAYLYTGQFLSKKRSAQGLAELFGIPLSSGTVVGITARTAGRLDSFLGRIRDESALPAGWVTHQHGNASEAG